MNDTLKIILGLSGGLAIFIFGMNMMSESLQKAAGEKMKTVLSLLTRNPILGVLAGALTTAVLQSSSATTVMAIGFVSAGLMPLPQAISIILGANIGTTMTAQIIAFKITDYIYVFIFLGFFLSFISKNEKLKHIGQSIFSFGLLFLGIETMGDVMEPLASSTFFLNLIDKVADIPILGVCVGLFMTLVVQSSSATIAVLQNFAAQAGPDGVTSIIGLTGAIPILLGDNIGTTITAIIASIGQSKDARRTAFAHCIFNISGAVLFLFLVKPYAALIQYLSPKGNEVDVISRQIANAHTGFNLTMTLIWIPLIPIMVKIVMGLVPEKNGKVTIPPERPKYLDERIVFQPAAALQLVAKECIRLGTMVQEILEEVKGADIKDEVLLVERITEKAEIEHALFGNISDYLTMMYSEGVLTEEQAADTAGIMYVLCDMDRIAQLCKSITENIARQNATKNKYSVEALKQLQKSFGSILDIYRDAMNAMVRGDDGKVKNFQKQKEEIMKLDKKMRKSHMERVGKKKCDAKLTIGFNDILHDIDRMGNSCVNLADAALNSASVKFFKTIDMAE